MCHSTVILVILFSSNRQMMLPKHGPGIIVKLKLLSCKKNSSLLDASFHMSVNQNDNHHGGPISLGIFMKAVDANLMILNVLKVHDCLTQNKCTGSCL